MAVTSEYVSVSRARRAVAWAVYSGEWERWRWVCSAEQRRGACSSGAAACTRRSSDEGLVFFRVVFFRQGRRGDLLAVRVVVRVGALGPTVALGLERGVGADAGACCGAEAGGRMLGGAAAGRVCSAEQRRGACSAEQRRGTCSSGAEAGRVLGGAAWHARRSRGVGLFPNGLFPSGLFPTRPTGRCIWFWSIVSGWTFFVKGGAALPVAVSS